MLKIASWNVNSLRVRLPHVLEWLKTEAPDVLALQETKVTDDIFPQNELKEAGYETVFAGQKTYNGVAFLSRHPIESVMSGIPTLDDPQRRILLATIAGVRIMNLYVPNGSSVESEKYVYKLDWLEKVTDWIRTEIEKNKKMVVLGDFNIAPADEDVHDPEAWADSVLVSGPERQAFETLLALGFKDSFRQFEQADESYSWWDYRAAGFRRNRGLRIDLILNSLELGNLCSSSRIDREPRRWERPSDHAPVIAEYDI